MTRWLHIYEGTAPLIVSFPHVGSEIPDIIEKRLISPWIGRKDADWWIPQLYDFAAGLGATIIRTDISRTVIDLNRDPEGTSLYPGQKTTGLCPVETFDGEPLYTSGEEPDDDEIAQRRTSYFDPYHQALRQQLTRLRKQYSHVVLYDAHAIRSCIPQLFSGTLPHLNIGTNDGASCSETLAHAVTDICQQGTFSSVCNGRFRGGWITRHYGQPQAGIHALQMELSFRGFLREPDLPDAGNWPVVYDPDFAKPLKNQLHRILLACLQFATTSDRD